MALITVEALDREALVKKLEALAALAKEGFDEHNEDCGASFAILKIGDDAFEEMD